MSDQQSTPAYLQEMAAQLADRTNTVMRVLNGDPPALAMDALLSAYATVVVGFKRTDQGAHMLRVLADMLDQQPTAQGLQQAVCDIPLAVLKVPKPERPAGALPPGYADDDMARIETLVATILDLLEGEKGHNGLSVLITCYSQVAHHLGEDGKAGRVLLETGARMLAEAAKASRTAGTAAPVPTGNANLH